MLKYLLPIGIVYIILAIIGVILIIREVKKEDNKEDMTLIIISFLVPLIGLIIYAINVGKDKHITECALKGLKMYLKFLLAQFIISVIVVIALSIFANFSYTTKKVNRVTPTTEVTTQEIEKKIQSSSYVNSVEVKVGTKIIYINIEFVEDTSKEMAKSIVKNTIYYFDNNYREKYDFSFALTSRDNSIEFLAHKSNNDDDIVWYD